MIPTETGSRTWGWEKVCQCGWARHMVSSRPRDRKVCQLLVESNSVLEDYCFLTFCSWGENRGKTLLWLDIDARGVKIPKRWDATTCRQINFLSLVKVDILSCLTSHLNSKRNCHTGPDEWPINSDPRLEHLVVSSMWWRWLVEGLGRWHTWIDGAERLERVDRSWCICTQYSLGTLVPRKPEKGPRYKTHPETGLMRWLRTAFFSISWLGHESSNRVRFLQGRVQIRQTRHASSFISKHVESLNVQI